MARLLKTAAVLLAFAVYAWAAAVRAAPGVRARKAARRALRSKP